MDRKGRNLIMAISYPPIFINAYLADKVPSALGTGRFSRDTMRFFPTLPTDINSLTETFPDVANDVFAVYDRMFKMRRRAFPHIKDEQLLYYFYKMHGDPVDLIETSQVVQDLLDRGDESAQELNEWLRDKQASSSPLVDDRGDKYPLVYFHDIKIYQLEETRDIIDFGTARTFAGNKIIIDYCYHSVGYPKGNPVEDFDPARPRYEDASNDTYNGTAL
jgi:hypothetical protein